MKTGAWFIHCFDVPTDIDIQDSSMVMECSYKAICMPVIIHVQLQQNVMMKKTTLSQGLYGYKLC